MPNRHFLRSDYLHIFFYIQFLVFVSLVHQIRIWIEEEQGDYPEGYES